METSLNKPLAWKSEASVKTLPTHYRNKLDAFFSNQAKNVTAWFLASLTFQGVFFLPLPVALTYYFGAPGYLVIVSLVLFFANIIAGMASAGIRAIFSILAASVVIHLLLLAFYLI